LELRGRKIGVGEFIDVLDFFNCVTMKVDTYFKVLTGDRWYPTLTTLCTSEEEAQKELASCKEMWANDEWWIEEGTQHVLDKCRGCADPINAHECFDAYGITTGHWCPTCYDSSAYPYRKDRYPTIEHHGYGERLDDDY
jgi:hypothetical protein